MYHSSSNRGLAEFMILQSHPMQSFNIERHCKVMDSVLRHDVLIQSETSQSQRDAVISYVAQNASELQAMISEKSHRCNASAYPRKPTKRCCNLRTMPEKMPCRVSIRAQ
ncbi:hypothetical protein M405DRAFT_44933 [Rhizopogon salebrosus TDB-379]|nr:hypothetical protein M405DRAFT_44933 [Rhizopogon salebrosus TDB-379]